MLLLFCFFLFFYLGDGSFFHRDTAVSVVTELYDNILFGDVDDDTVKTAGGYNCIANFHLVDHG